MNVRGMSDESAATRSGAVPPVISVRRTARSSFSLTDSTLMHGLAATKALMTWSQYSWRSALDQSCTLTVTASPVQSPVTRTGVGRGVGSGGLVGSGSGVAVASGALVGSAVAVASGG